MEATYSEKELVRVRWATHLLNATMAPSSHARAAWHDMAPYASVSCGSVPCAQPALCAWLPCDLKRAPGIPTPHCAHT